MPLKDVKVSINIRKAARLVGLGKPLILARFAGPSTYQNFSEPEAVAEVFGKESIAHKLATTLLKQGDTSPAVLSIATYNPEAVDDTPKTAAAALAKHFDEDFYFITADTQVASEVKAIADVTEGEGLKIFATTVTTIADLTTLGTNKYDRTFAMYHETPGEYPAEALVGGHGSKEVGSITYMNKKLVGITPQEFSAAKLSEIEALYGFAYVQKAGFNATSEGTMLSGEYIDVIHSKDWLIVNGTQALQEQLIRNDKVAYTDKGFVILAQALENVLKAGVVQDMISVTDNVPDYSIVVLPRTETNPADRAGRVYKGLSFSFGLAGAVHSANVVGEMII